MSGFNDMLSYLRKRNNLSQQELSDKTGIKRSAIGMYETGMREPNFETLELFADFFNVSIDILLGRTSTSDNCPCDFCSDCQRLDLKREIELLSQLDNEDRAEIRGEMKQMLKNEKYTAADDVQKNA